MVAKESLGSNKIATPRYIKKLPNYTNEHTSNADYNHSDYLATLLNLFANVEQYPKSKLFTDLSIVV